MGGAFPPPAHRSRPCPGGRAALVLRLLQPPPTAQQRPYDEPDRLREPDRRPTGRGLREVLHDSGGSPVSTVRGLASSGGCCSEQLNSGTHRACVAVVEQVGKSLSRLRTTDRCRTRLGPNGFPTASRSGRYRDPRRHRHAGKEGDQFRVQPIHPMSKRPDRIFSGVAACPAASSADRVCWVAASHSGRTECHVDGP